MLAFGTHGGQTLGHLTPELSSCAPQDNDRPFRGRHFGPRLVRCLNVNRNGIDKVNRVPKSQEPNRVGPW